MDQLDAQMPLSPHHELSEEILRDARARLDMLQHSVSPLRALRFHTHTDTLG